MSRLRHADGGTALDDILDRMDGSPLTAAERPAVTINDRALLIYTSGTTGLPKAASISHRRILNWGGWFAGLTGASPEDRLYDCLPSVPQRRRHRRTLQHAERGRLGGAVGQILGRAVSGATSRAGIARCSSISANSAAICSRRPPSEFETSHRLRLACGNGLRGDIWEAFQARFAIPRILEFYAATEGNFSLYNVEGKPGAIGRIPPLLAHRFPAAIVRVDPEHRHARSRCGWALHRLRARRGRRSGGPDRHRR